MIYLSTVIWKRHFCSASFVGSSVELNSQADAVIAIFVVSKFANQVKSALN